MLMVSKAIRCNASHIASLLRLDMPDDIDERAPFSKADLLLASAG
jgi:hypothetical protein